MIAKHAAQVATELAAVNRGIEAPMQSQMDNSKVLTRTQWAVTLIIPDELLSHHAELFVEGNKDGRYFASVIHLTGVALIKNGCDASEGCHYLFSDKGQVKVKELKSGTKWLCKLKSDTFIRSAEKVQKLIDEAKKEEDLYSNKEFTNPTPFHYLGANSVLARESVHYQITDPELREIYDTNRRQFEYLRKASLNPGHEATTITIGIMMRVFTIPLFGIPGLAYSYYATGSATCSHEINISTTLGKADYQKSAKFYEVREKVKTHIIEHKVQPNSCMSWTKEKLKIVDVVIPDLFWDKIISVTDLHIGKMQDIKV